MRRMILPIFKKYKKLLISIMIVSAMGCAFMTGLSAAYVSLGDSLYQYLDEYCYPDAVITTEVTNRDMIDKLKSLGAVEEANARLCGDTYLKSSGGRYLSVRIFSYNDNDKQQFHLWSTADNDGEDDIYLEYNFAADNHIKAGDTVEICTDEGYRKYFVSGIVTCPETISVQPTDDSWGVNTDFGYAYAPVRLLTAEYEKRHDQVKEQVKSSYDFDNSAVKKRIDDNLKAIETMSILMPVIFFIIILIVVFLFMSLIVKQSRRDIGILRALGFSKTSIKVLFCAVNLVVSLFSIVIGSIIGYCLMRYVGDYYADFFPLPAFTFRFDMGMFGLSAICTIIVGQISTLISTGTISRILPSEAMSRPAPEAIELPHFARRLTKNASPVTKFCIAILFRNKMRFVFSVICIAASVMMIFSSLAFITSKNYLLHQLYDERIHYDCQIFFDKDPDDEIIEELSALKYVSDVQRLPFYQTEIELDGKIEKAVINSLSPDTDLVGIYDAKNKKMDIPKNGIILEKHLAQSIGASIGDTVKIKGQDITVDGISDQSVSRFQYMSYKAAEKLGDVTIGSLICNIDKDDEQKLLEFLTDKASERYQSAQNTLSDDNTEREKKDGANYLYTVFTRLAFEGNEKIFKTYDLAAWIIIGFAIIIGLVIVINIAQTNLLEKKRELCVMRTLGFRHNDISKKWFLQSFLQFIFSCIIGLPIGVFIAKYGLQQLSTSAREYVFANSITEYIFTILLVLAYVIISHFIAMHSMKKWDLVESVKDKE